MVSMKDIAKQCNVSVASVSKALNGYSDISEETRQLILKTASEMGYLPNSSARALKTRRSYNLGVLFVDEAMSGLTHDYFNHVLESFKRTAESRGYDITFTSGNLSGQHLSYYEHCRYRGVDGVVIACINFFTEEVQRLVQSEIPVVTIDHVFDGRIAVVSNNREWKNLSLIFLNGDTERLPIFTEKIPLSHETDLEVFTELSRKNESIYLMNICQSFLIEMQKLQQ